MKERLLFLLVLLIILQFPVLCQSKEPPKGWHKAGNYPEGYKLITDNKIRHTGKKSGFLSSISLQEDEIYFGTMVQSFLTDTSWTGKQIKMTVYLKTKDVEAWAGAWMRIDGKEETLKDLRYDDMRDTPIKGTTDWKQYDITLYVPKESWKVVFGTMLSGSGQVWVDDVVFELITNDNKTSRIKKNIPLNLDFED